MISIWSSFTNKIPSVIDHCYKKTSWLSSLHCLLSKLTLSIKFEWGNHLGLYKCQRGCFSSGMCRPRCGPAADLVLCVWDLETCLTVPSSFVSSPRRSSWWMGSNQQQTDLPQETSPHHVYGNQHFSRDPLIAAPGGRAGESKKTIRFSFVYCKSKSADRLNTIWFIGLLPNDKLNNTVENLLGFCNDLILRKQDLFISHCKKKFHYAHKLMYV